MNIQTHSHLTPFMYNIYLCIHTICDSLTHICSSQSIIHSISRLIPHRAMHCGMWCHADSLIYLDVRFFNIAVECGKLERAKDRVHHRLQIKPTAFSNLYSSAVHVHGPVYVCGCAPYLISKRKGETFEYSFNLNNPIWYGSIRYSSYYISWLYYLIHNTYLREHFAVEEQQFAGVCQSLLPHSIEHPSI